MASSRARWAGNLAGAVLVVGVGFAVNRIAGSVTVMAGWFSAAVAAQILGNIVVARQARAAASVAGDPPVPPALVVPDWVVDRAQVALGVAAVRAGGGRGRTVGITTGLHGAGGFGKSTVALMVGADRRVRRRFRGRVYTVTIGRDVRSRAQIAAIVAAQTRFITGDTEVFDDPIEAGQHLGRLLAQRPRTLLIIDDVWEAEQLEPFLLGAPNCVRLVTTRVPGILPPGSEHIFVDRMSAEQARRTLTWQLPTLSESVVVDLIEVTGRWPLLVRLANRTIEAKVSTGADATSEATALLERLRQEGPEAVNRPGQPMDLDDPVHRNMLVHASVEAAVGLLPGEGGTRFRELGVFAEDEAVPIKTVAWLWQATGGLGEDETRHTCRLLAGLSLLALDPAEGGRVALHDVIRDYLRAQLGADGLEHVNRLFVEQIASRLPPAGPLAEPGTVPGHAWWDLDGYMLDHAIEHLLDAGWAERAEGVATDLRWVQARLHQRGPVAPWSDLSRIAIPRAAERARDLLQIAHLLTPIDPPHSLDAIMHSRLEHLPVWGAQIATLRQGQPELPRLVNNWHLPDLPDQMLQHALTGHTDWVNAVAISPDGTWLASAGGDKVVRIWDRATGKNIVTLTGHTDRVNAVAISPDGTWLASAGSDKVVRIWDPTGKNTTTLTGHTGWVRALAISPDGTWLATAGGDEVVRIWDRATGKNIVTLTGHADGVNAVAISPDGTWLASAGSDKVVRIWDRTTGKNIVTLTGHTDGVSALAISPDGTWLATAGGGEQGETLQIWDRATGNRTRGTEVPVTRAVAISPDGTWLATAGDDRVVRIWDLATGENTTTLTGHTSTVSVLAISPDSTWLASAGYDETVRIWGLASSRNTATAPAGHTGYVHAVAISPDGTWLATAGVDWTVRIWDRATGENTAILTGHTGWVSAVAISPDGTWLATAGGDEVVRIWDRATGESTAILTGHTGWVSAVAISPDGTWLASAGHDKMVRIWDRTTGKNTTTLTGHIENVNAVAISPDGTWLATAGWDTGVGIWDRTTGEITAMLLGHHSLVNAVAISPDGTWLATADWDGAVRIWDRATGETTAVLKGHKGQVSAVAISPDGAWLATTGDDDDTVRIWSVRSLPRAVTAMRVDGSLSCCAWAADSRSLAVCGAQGPYLFLYRPATRAT